MNLTFRALRADEVECRIGQASDKGVSLLLYKDARCDMNVLDETVGPLFWKREHSRDNANCTVSIWDDVRKQWVSKEDTGTESRTEAEKGLASDSFKRACTNWGIGRELYTAPRIWIRGANRNDRFWVKEMKVQDHVITKLVICACDTYGGPLDLVAFDWTGGKRKPKVKEILPAGRDLRPMKLRLVKMMLAENEIPEAWIAGKYGKAAVEDIPEGGLDQIALNIDTAKASWLKESNESDIVTK